MRDVVPFGPRIQAAQAVDFLRGKAAQGNALVQRGDKESLASGALERRRDPGHSEAVGARLDYARHGAMRADSCLEQGVIGRDSGQINGQQAGRGCRIQSSP